MNKMITFRVGADQNKILSKFADSEGKSVSEFVRETIFEKIEDEMDIELFNERKNAPDRFKEKPRSLDEVIEILGL